MQRFLMSLLIFLCLLGGGLAQQDATPDKGPGANQAPPRSERNKEAEESSSRETRIDIAPPKDDAKTHPNSRSAIEDMESPPPATTEDVQEFHPWEPMRALKDIEVGDYYFRRKNYRAALSRYQDALYYKDKDAAATFHLAQCQEKLGQPEEALDNYQGYLKILPHGPLSEEAQKSIERLKAKGVTVNSAASSELTDQPKEDQSKEDQPKP